MSIDHAKHEHLYWLAEKLFNAKIFAKEVDSIDRGFAVLLAGDEMGFAPMVSARSLSFVKNKLSLNAEAQVAACMRHSAICLYFRLVETTAERAVYETLRAGSPEKVTLAYTIDQAKKANLLSNGTWQSHPAAMLRARCSSALAKAVFPDLVAGLVDPDEADEIRRVEGIPQIPAQVPVRQDTAPRIDPAAEVLAAYRARLAACPTLDALVATMFELAPTVAGQRDAAWTAAVTRAGELATDEETLRAAATQAATITKEPQAWATVAKVLVGLAGATDRAAVNAVVKSHGADVGKLPEALKAQMNTVRAARVAAVSPPANDDAAAQFEDEIKRAATIPDLEAVNDKITAAVKSGAVTHDQAKALVALYDKAATALEREVAA